MIFHWYRFILTVYHLLECIFLLIVLESCIVLGSDTAKLAFTKGLGVNRLNLRAIRIKWRSRPTLSQINTLTIDRQHTPLTTGDLLTECTL
jgi:hypothetical protein